MQTQSAIGGRAVSGRPLVHAASAALQERVLAVITLAFAADPFVRYWLPDPLSDTPAMLAPEPQPDRILAALMRELSPESIVSLQFRYDPPAAHTPEDEFLRLQCLLSQPPVYQAFGVRTLALRFPFRKTRGFEVVGSLANLLAEGGIHSDFVPGPEIAFSESKTFLDLLFAHDYSLAEAYVIDGGWCEWFIDEGMLDKTLLVGRRDAWWLLAITSTD